MTIDWGKQDGQIFKAFMASKKWKSNGNARGAGDMNKYRAAMVVSWF